LVRSGPATRQRSLRWPSRPAGRWIAAPPIEGTLVVNIGDLLARWSNDRFRSTLHRVVNRSGKRRLSIPVFYDPDTDAVIDPRDMGLAPGEAARHAPVTAGDYIMSRNRLSFAHYAESDSVSGA
jgi:isopenicillin N synthase-like dioxygenase